MTDLDHRAVLAQLREINAERSERLLVRAGEKLAELSAAAKDKAETTMATRDRLIALIGKKDELEARKHNGKVTAEEWTDQSNRLESAWRAAERAVEQAEHDEKRAREIFQGTAQRLRQEVAGVAY